MKGLFLLSLMVLPSAALSETFVCLPEALDGPLSVRFDVDDAAGTVTLFQTQQVFVLVENTPQQIMFEEGDPQDELTLHYIAKAPTGQTGQWISDRMTSDAGTVTTLQGVCYVL